MGVINYKIETASGIYTVRRPIGRIGAIHFSILSGHAPTSGEEKATARDLERLAEGFEIWANKVLPHIIIDGPFNFEEMPGEDQYAIYMALMSQVNVSEDFFRFVE